MTDDELKLLATHTGMLGVIDDAYLEYGEWVAILRHFADMVISAEREACAAIADDSDHIVDGRGCYDQLGDAKMTAANIAAAIRARKG